MLNHSLLPSIITGSLLLGGLVAKGTCSELSQSAQAFVDQESVCGDKGAYYAEAGRVFVARRAALDAMASERKNRLPIEGGGTARARYFNVRDFGALGDGAADDSTAFQQAFGAMRKANGEPTVLVVPSGRYAMRSVVKGAQLWIGSLTNAVIAGTNAEVCFGVFDASGCELEHCDNVVVQGLSFEWEKTPFFQGRILEIDLEKAIVVARKTPGTLSPCDACWIRQTKGVHGEKLSGLQYYCASMHDAQTGRIFPEASWNFFLCEAEDLGNDVFRIQLDPSSRYDRRSLRVGCDLVIPCRDNHCYAVRLKSSVFCSVIDCVVRSSRSSAFASSGTSICPSFIDCRVEPKNGLSLSSNADGCISLPGTVVCNCRFRNMGDDGVNIRNVGMQIVDFEKPRTLVVPWRDELRIGGFLAMFDPMRGDYLQGAVVAAIERFSLSNRDCARMTLDRDITVPIETLSDIDLSSAEKNRLITQGVIVPKRFPTQVYAIDALGMGSVVRDCEIASNRGCGVVMQDSFSLVENCTVDGMKSGMRVGALARYREGPAPICVSVRHNRLLNNVNAFNGLVEVMRGGPGDASPMRGVVFADNVISNASRNATSLHNFDFGGESLFNGRDFAGWCHTDGRPVDTGWSVENGAMTLMPNRIWAGEGKWKWQQVPNGRAVGGLADIMTANKYRDFDFRFEFKLTKGANSGIKYFYNPERNQGTALEYQVLDTAHPIPPNMTAEQFKNRRVASLYQFYAANADCHLKPLGEWNVGRILSKGRHVEHWLNGVKVVEYERGDDKFHSALKQTKWGGAEFSADGAWGEAEAGHILLQDHEDRVYYRNLRISGTPVAPKTFRPQPVEGDATSTIQGAIDNCFRAGGGEVRLGKGKWNVGAIRVRSNVTLYLESGCSLIGTRDIERYYILEKDTVEPVNPNLVSHEEWYQSDSISKDTIWRLPGNRWNNALIRLYKAENAAIIGEPGSLIDGSLPYDEGGEELYRGPLGINAIDCKNLTFRGYTINNTGNWAPMGSDPIELIAGRRGACFAARSPSAPCKISANAVCATIEYNE